MMGISRPIWAAAAIVATVWWFDFTLAMVLLVAFAFGWAVLGSIHPMMPGPHRPKQHHWGLGFGIGLTFAGIFPFITIYRRRRL